MVALAGGPGQAALPLAERLRASARAAAGHARPARLRPARHRAARARCAATAPRWPRDARRRSAACARAARRRRAATTATLDSVEDIEALRVAGGYSKLVLYGVSYGTKVALGYAARYPDRVAALVLDSVVPADGPDPFARIAFARLAPRAARAVRRRRVQARDAERHARPAAAPRHARAQPLRGLASTRRAARRVSVRSTRRRSGDILLAGDLNPALRAELPARCAAMLRGDAAPMLRLAPAPRA